MSFATQCSPTTDDGADHPVLHLYTPVHLDGWACLTLHRLTNFSDLGAAWAQQTAAHKTHLNIELAFQSG